ncbi:ribonuclease Z [archaeon]|jgi:ribonuclease Z|nr:ribonuclease Z [archaeon]
MAKITFLGTADSIPSKSRNHLSVLLNYDGENILFDCGEGTQRQFRKAELNPCKVTRILISHWHGDHVLGLPGLLSTLSLSGYTKTLYLYGPRGIKKKFEDMLRVFSFVQNYEIKVEEVGTARCTPNCGVKGQRFFENEDFYLEAFPLEHGIPCNGYNFVKKGQRRIDKDKLKKFKIKEGRYLLDLKEGKDLHYENKKYKNKDLTYLEKDKKVSFVVDTRFNPKISGFVENANILIGESTFSRELKKDAREKMHLTSEDIGNIAKKAGVDKLILAHISSRYLKDIKQILNEVKEIFKNSYLVKDLDSLEF